MPMPQATAAVLPSLVSTINQLNPQQSYLTPQDVLKPLPSIVDTAPMVLDQTAAGLSGCNPITQWVTDNPLLAAGVLFGVWWWLANPRGR